MTGGINKPSEEYKKCENQDVKTEESRSSFANR
jgi:hypothetical protein